MQHFGFPVQYEILNPDVTVFKMPEGSTLRSKKPLLGHLPCAS
jgi:hypothetical protein